jgi:hypothetical protein
MGVGVESVQVQLGQPVFELTLLVCRNMSSKTGILGTSKWHSKIVGK